MTKWSKAHPHTDCALVARADRILNEIAQFVPQYPRKELEIDPWEQAVRSANPRSPYTLHDWVAYMGDKEMRGAHKALRQFRRNAHHQGKSFFQSLRIWLLTPFRTSSPQPTEGSTRWHLPHFSREPPWDQDKSMSMMKDIIRPQEGFKLGSLTWKRFCKVIKQPKKKAPGPDKISPLLLRWLSKELPWDLYQAIPDVWEKGEIPSHWLEARLSLLHKKGNTAFAMNYRPIVISNCIYIVLARLLLDAIRQPINTALSDTQAGSRTSYTTSQQAMNLLLELHERHEGSYISLLDNAKAFPSTPHVCLV